MADSEVVTGSRDNVRVDPSRCLRMRFSGSSCRRCIDICPHGAVTVDNSLDLAPGKCRGCLLCTSVCPVGALEPGDDFNACLTQLAKVPEPVLGCILTKEQSNGWLQCLGGLSDEHLLAISHRYSGTLTLNASLCNNCPNSAILPLLHKRLELLAGPGSGAGKGTINAVENSGQISHREETLDRRTFFKSLRKSLFRTAAVVLSATSEQTGKRSDYMAKRLPARRELLNHAIEGLCNAEKKAIQARFFGQINISDACTYCQGCVAICPTGALQTSELALDNSPLFDPNRCTACGLCAEFCIDNALNLCDDGLS